MVEVANALLRRCRDLALMQKLVDIEQPAAGEDALELVLQKLVHAGAAGDDDSTDVEVVERVGDAMEQHPIVGGDLLAARGLAAGGLRVAAAEVTGRQHGLHPGIVEQRQRGQANLAEQPLGAAARKIEHRLGILAGTPRITQDRHRLAVLQFEHAAHVVLGKYRQRSPYQVHHLLGDPGRPGGRCRPPGLAHQSEAASEPMGVALCGVAEFQHPLAQCTDQQRLCGVEERQRQPGAEAAVAPTVRLENGAHTHGDVTEVDIDRARRLTLVADGAVVGDVVHLGEVAHRDTAPGLLLVEERLDDQAGGKDLVARRVEQVGARHVGGADRLAFAAAEAVLDRLVERPELARLENQRLLFDQAQRRRVGVVKPRAGQQFAAVEVAVRIDFFLVGGKCRGVFRVKVAVLGQADAVLAGDDATKGDGEAHHLVDDPLGLVQHRVVVGVDRDVGVHVAVASMHVGGDEQSTGTN